MAEISSRFLPVSHLALSSKSRGFLADWTNQCERCDRQCETSLIKGLALCSYGVNYARVTPNLLLFGFIIRGESISQAQIKATRQNPQSVVDRSIVVRTLEILQTDAQLFQNSREKAVQKVMDTYKQEAMYKTDLLEVLKPEIKRSLAFLHDYKQFVARVRQHINVVFQSRYPDQSLDEQLVHALPSEKAIYWSAALMEDKINTALLLTQPERLANAPRSQFRLHGFILKHVRIYQVAFDEKEIRLLHTGQSFGYVTAPQAFAAVPHTLLDNALKYSVRGSQVVMDFKENDDAIEFSVTSYGPKIEADEAKTIFELFKRGAAGVVQHEEGSGIGLYLAQFVARDLGSEIKVKQAQQKSHFGYETTFWLSLSRSA
jgi:signal transduction histidine kinase